MTEATARDRALGWGRQYAMVRPEHFRVDYVINPYMDPRSQPDSARATRQWEDLAARLESHGADLYPMGQLPQAPDMVFAMNLGLALTDGAGRRRVVLSHMRYPQRRLEQPSARRWFEAAGFAPTDIATDVGLRLFGVPCFEAGDAFPFAGSLLVGYGPRTQVAALLALATALDVEVIGVRITHPGMYHLDLAFCPLDAATALVCPAAFEAAGAAALLGLVPDPIVLSEREALTFCANSVVVGRDVLMPACPPRVRRHLESRGFAVDLVDVDEFHKGGGSVRCLTNPLDIAVGRDLDVVPGGRVRLLHGREERLPRSAGTREVRYSAVTCS